MTFSKHIFCDYDDMRCLPILFSLISQLLLACATFQLRDWSGPLSSRKQRVPQPLKS